MIPSTPSFVTIAQMQGAMKYLGFTMIGVKPHAGLVGVSLWKHPARPNLEFTVSDADYQSGARLMYTIELARDIFARAQMFLSKTPDSAVGVRFHLEGPTTPQNT